MEPKTKSPIIERAWQLHPNATRIYQDQFHPAIRVEFYNGDGTGTYLLLPLQPLTEYTNAD